MTIHDEPPGARTRKKRREDASSRIGATSAAGSVERTNLRISGRGGGTGSRSARNRPRGHAPNREPGHTLRVGGKRRGGVRIRANEGVLRLKSRRNLGSRSDDRP